MPYVLRTPDGQIDSLHRDARTGAQWLPPDHPELRRFLASAAPAVEAAAHPGADPDPESEAGFASLDAGLIRVVEDLVDVLVARNVINITDLPSEAQHKLFARKNFRERFQRNALQLFEAPEHLLVGAAPAEGDGTDWLAAVATSGLVGLLDPLAPVPALRRAAPQTAPVAAPAAAPAAGQDPEPMRPERSV
jgi:hypothetical protein